MDHAGKLHAGVVLAIDIACFVQHVQVGHSDRVGGGNMSWNSTHPVKGCSLEDFYLEDVHGGLFYCFAID